MPNFTWTELECHQEAAVGPAVDGELGGVGVLFLDQVLGRPLRCDWYVTRQRFQGTSLITSPYALINSPYKPLINLPYRVSGDGFGVYARVTRKVDG